MATLGQLAHEKFTDAAVGRLLDDLQPYAESLPYESDDAGLLRVTRHDYERAIKVPPSFTAQFYSHSAASYEAWTKARPANDFAQVAPYLERTLELSRELAACYPGAAHIADPLIDREDEGLTVATTRALFAELRRELVPLVEAICARPPVDDACRYAGTFPEADQLRFGERVVRRIGYDFGRGRQDKTHHPFMIKMSLGDVRITTRVRLDDVLDAFFFTVHESGHALYEQGIRRDFEGTPLGGGASAGCTRASRACGRTWSDAAARSGSASTRSCSRRSRRWRRCRSRPSTARPTRCSARSSASTPTR